jgi:hypothetical protein
MVNPSSDRSTSRSFCSAAAASAPGSVGIGSSDASAVEELLPTFADSGPGGVAVEEEEDEAAEGVVVVAVGEELGDAFEGEDPADRLNNNPEISERLRTFHIV